MISFNIRCSKEHVFEAWFKNGAAYDEQAAAGEIDLLLDTGPEELIFMGDEPAADPPPLLAEKEKTVPEAKEETSGRKQRTSW